MIKLNSSVICFYRKDSEDRERNLKILLDFYHKNYEGFQFIVMEQYEESSNIIFKDYPNVLHEYVPEIAFSWNKMIAYNEGVKNSFYENLIFNDVDVIFNPLAVKESLDVLSRDTKKVILPSDGHFVCIKEPVTEKFKEDLTYKFLFDHIDLEKYNTLYAEDENFSIGSTNSPGGGFITKKRNIFNCNGFNTHFKGWGYEDNETLIRFNKMGFTVARLAGQNINLAENPLFHLDHKNVERESNPHYKVNENIFKFVQKLDSKLLYLYSNTWKM